MTPAGHALPPGTRIGEVEIIGLVGEGGFGIVYLAHDPSLQRRVAVKEYMPSSLAMRTADGITVAVRSERHRETFEAGLASFVNEARLLARFDHPALVKVYRFWQANGTAFMMMPFYEGPTLKEALSRDGPPDEATLRGWLAPLLDALALMHDASCFHRDIAPDNILLTPAGPLLLDFGAARRVIGDMTQALTVVLKPGYAPIEQYGESARMLQGAWTDLYALGCVVRYAITGQAPVSSVERLMDDTLPPLAALAEGRYSHRFLQAIDAAMSVRPQFRPQDVAAFRALLGPAPAPRIEAVRETLPTIDIPTELQALPTPASPGRRRSGPIIVATLTIAVSAAALWFATRGGKAHEAPVAATSHEPAASGASAAQAGTSDATPSAPMMNTNTPTPSPVAASMPRTAASSTDKPRIAAVRASAPPRAAAASVAAPRPQAESARCAEILQRASLGPLSADETAFLKRDCR